MLNFTEEELNNFIELSLEYRKKQIEIKRLGETIESAENSIKNIISDLENLENEEFSLYKNLSEKYDVDITTVQKLAAQSVLDRYIQQNN